MPRNKNKKSISELKKQLASSQETKQSTRGRKRERSPLDQPRSESEDYSSDASDVDDDLSHAELLALVDQSKSWKDLVRSEAIYEFGLCENMQYLKELWAARSTSAS